jgi:hypothetical protein
MFRLDEAWPLLTFVFRDHVSEADFDAYLTAYERVIARGDHWVSIFDARDVKPLEAKLVRRQAEWIKRHAEVLTARNLGIAFVIPSPMIRGVLKAILWLQPLPQQHVVVANMDAAHAWCELQLRGAGLQATRPQ